MAYASRCPHLSSPRSTPADIRCAPTRWWRNFCRQSAAGVYAKNAIEMNRRQSDCVIVSQGLDRSIHGGVSEKKEIDPYNRGSVVLGSVAYYMDRYGYDVLPLALRLLAGERLPPRTVTQHVLVTAANVFREYPPFDMN